MSPAALVVGVVDSTTLLGRDLRSVLSERRFPSTKVLLFHSKDVSEGLLADDRGEPAWVGPLASDALEVCQLAFFCGRAEDTGRFLARRTVDRCLAIDLSGLRTGGPFASPSEAQPPELLPEGNLLLTHDPTATVLWEAARALERLSPVTAISAAIDRPASEMEKDALDELFQQAIALASFRAVPKEIFGTQSAFNIYHPADSQSWEARVAEDFRRLSGRDLPLTLLSARAGVFHGHHMRIEARFEKDAPPRDEVRRVLRQSTAFAEVDPEDLSGPVECAGRDETLILRIWTCGQSVCLALASDHLRRPGAVLGVRLAEQALREGRLEAAH